jgi:hypothetical protein
MLNRSMPSTAGATISILPNKSGLWSVPLVNLSRDKEHNLHLPDEVYQIRSGFLRYILTSAHASLQVLTLPPYYHESRLPNDEEMRAFIKEYEKVRGKPFTCFVNQHANESTLASNIPGGMSLSGKRNEQCPSKCNLRSSDSYHVDPETFLRL